MISIAAIVSFFGILRIEANPGTQLKRFQPTHSPTHLYLLANGTLVGSLSTNHNAANQNTETKLWEKRSPLGLVYGSGNGGSHESSSDNGLAYIEVSNEADLLTNIQIRGDGSQVLEFKGGLEETLEDTNGCSHKMCYQVSNVGCVFPMVIWSKFQGKKAIVILVAQTTIT